MEKNFSCKIKLGPGSLGLALRRDTQVKLLGIETTRGMHFTGLELRRRSQTQSFALNHECIGVDPADSTQACVVTTHDRALCEISVAIHIVIPHWNRVIEFNSSSDVLKPFLVPA
jgi:hypothetical protein